MNKATLLISEWKTQVLCKSCCAAYPENNNQDCIFILWKKDKEGVKRWDKGGEIKKGLIPILHRDRDLRESNITYLPTILCHDVCSVIQYEKTVYSKST